MTSLNDYPRIIFDSNKVLGTFVEHAYSPNGEHCAFTISVGNQNIHKILVIDVRSGRPFGKCLRLFSCEKVAWSGDSRGFFIYVNILMQNVYNVGFDSNSANYFQYDPEGKKKRNLYYHYVDEDKPDKLISKIRKVDANAVSINVSHDYKYLILRGSRMLSVASIKSLDRDIKFDLIFKFSPDVTYVSSPRVYRIHPGSK